MQAAGVAIVFLGELRAGVQARENHFDAAHAFFGVFVDRHSAAVVGNGNRVVVVQRNDDLIAIAGNRFVGGVVDDFLREMIRPLRRRVHARAFAHRLESREDFDRGRIVGARHWRADDSAATKLRRGIDALRESHRIEAARVRDFAVGEMAVGIGDA